MVGEVECRGHSVQISVRSTFGVSSSIGSTFGVSVRGRDL